MAEHQLDRPPTTTPRLYVQDGQGYGATVHAHYFLGGSDWLITEYDPDDDVAFGWACLHGDRQNAELGYVNMAELESVVVGQVITLAGVGTGTIPVRVEREHPWTPTTLTDAIDQLDRASGRTR